MLDKIRGEWRRRGWPLENLASFSLSVGQGDPPPPPAPPPEPPPPAPPRTFTQEEVNAFLARDRKDAKAAAAELVAKELGVSLADAKTLIEQAKSREDAEKTDAQREREAAEAEKRAAVEEKTAAAQERHSLRVERALLVAGIQDEAKIARLARLLDVEVGAEPQDIATGVEALKTEFPELFGASGEGGPPPPNGDPKGKPPKPASEDAYARGLERAKKTRSTTGYALPDLTT